VLCRYVPEMLSALFRLTPADFLGRNGSRSETVLTDTTGRVQIGCPGTAAGWCSAFTGGRIRLVDVGDVVVVTVDGFGFADAAVGPLAQAQDDGGEQCCCQ
jgi:hypothetical protein